MKKQIVKRLFSLVMAGVMTVSVFTSGMAASTITVQAEENTWVSVEALTDTDTAAPKADEVVPDANQYQYQKDELAAFCHFGPNTFNEIEWGEHYGDSQPSDIFALTEDFDAQTLVETIHEAGFQKLIITAKHHDGFCIWPSAYTEYDSEAAGYKGDILADISYWCTEYDIDMGLYLSPWDIHEPSYGYYDENGNPITGVTPDATGKVAGDVLDYNDYYNNQLQEILGNDKYGNDGHFVEVWMDGAKGSGANSQEYDFQRWFTTIQENEGKASGKYEADCMLFGAQAYTTVRWIGNEDGYAHETTWAKSKVDYEANTIDSGTKTDGVFQGFEDGNKWTVPECDARITSGWFWGTQKKTPKSMSALAEMYFRSVGQNGVLLLNIPPNNEGGIDEAIVERTLEFGEAVKNTFDDNMAAAEGVSISASAVRGNDVTYSPANVLDGDDSTYWTVDDGATTGQLLIDLGATKTFDVVSLEEAIEFGQRITSYKVEYRNGESDTWKTFDEGTTIGSKRLGRDYPVKGSQLRITVSTATTIEGKTAAVPMLSEVGVYKAEGGLALGSSAPEGMEVIDITDNDTSDGMGITAPGWIAETGNQYINGTNKYANANATLTVNFTGTKIYLMGTKAPNHGNMSVAIDGGEPETISTTVESRATGQVIYESDDLADGSHTLTLTVLTQAIGMEAAYVINNGGAGMVGIEQDAYSMNEDSAIDVKLVRYGGCGSEATVILTPNPGTAIQDDYNTELIHTVTFAAGEKEKTVNVQTRRNTNRTGDQYFTVELSAETEGLILGFKDKAKVNILDTEYSVATIRALIDECNVLKGGHYTTGSWTELQECLASTIEKIADENISRKEIQRAYDKLADVKEKLVERTAFTEEDPFVFPSGLEEVELAEAEFFALDDEGAAEGKEVRLADKTWDEEAVKVVDWFESGNKIHLPYTAKYAGIYTVTMKYRSGRGESNPNAVNWSGTKITSGALDVYGENNATTTHTAEFDVVLTDAGAGTLTFTADENASPVIDYFEIKPKEFAYNEYTITATAGEHGAIEAVAPEGGAAPEVDENGNVVISEVESQEYRIIPEEGYVIADVVVNGESVGAVDTYTVVNPTADVTISATFAFGYYTAANPYQFPATKGASGTLELEYGILENSGENEAWPLQITKATWASNGAFVNCLSPNDTVTLHYNAPVGSYNVTLTYRSGSNSNSFAWSEADNKITAGTVGAGNGDASVTMTKEFTLEVTTAGQGTLVFTAPTNAGAPQMDKFEIVMTEAPIHAGATEWSKDETNHWHACTQEGCTEVYDRAAHTYGNWTETVPPTCEQAGTETRSCSVCGYSETRDVAVVAHTVEDWEETTPATCTEPGVKTGTCTSCGNTITEEIEAKDHAFAEDFTVDKAETCTEAGSKSKHCTHEGCDSKTEETAIPAHGHTWDTGVVTKEPTETAEGVKTYTCKVCKTATRTEAIEKLPTVTPEPAPTPKPVKKGKTFKVNGVTYKVTKSHATKGEVAFAKTTSKGKSITIPATVKKDGITYKVTSIANNAFKNNKNAAKITIGKNVKSIGTSAFAGCTKLTNLTIPANVAKIGATAFNNCKKLRTITIKTTKLTSKSVTKKAFKGISTKTTIKVPAKKLKAYKSLFKSKGLSSKVKVKK